MNLQPTYCTELPKELNAMTPTPLDAKPQGAQLKPCPFCGNADSTHTETCFFTVWEGGNGDDIEAWNRRAPDTEAAERIEKLERENERLRLEQQLTNNILDELSQERDTALRELAKARRDADYRLYKLELVIPLFQEARDALTALTVQQIRLHGIRSDLASRMDYAGTANVEQYLETVAAHQPEKDANNG